jgi:hypothetical protein
VSSSLVTPRSLVTNGDGVIVAPPTPSTRSTAAGRSRSHSFAARSRLRSSRNGSPAAGISRATLPSATSVARASAPAGTNSVTCGIGRILP